MKSVKKHSGCDHIELIRFIGGFIKRVRATAHSGRFSNACGIPQQRERVTVDGLGAIGNKPIDKSGESGIIEVGSEGMYRKSKSGKIEPMPKKQLRKIVKAYNSNGGTIQMSEEIDKYLDNNHAEAITYNSKTILLKRNPGRASVYEELIHASQYRKGKNDGSYVSRLKCEIEAQEKLIKYSKQYKLTNDEIVQTKEALRAYKEELDVYYKNGGG